MSVPDAWAEQFAGLETGALSAAQADGGTPAARSGKAGWFESKAADPWTRAAANLRESAWWSYQLASRSAMIVGVLTGLVALFAVVLLLLGAMLSEDVQFIGLLARVTTAIILGGVVLNLGRTAWRYGVFGAEASEAEKAADGLEAQPSPEAAEHRKFEVIRRWHEYQIARASAPLLSSWLYQRYRDKLNGEWDRHRAASMV